MSKSEIEIKELIAKLELEREQPFNNSIKLFCFMGTQKFADLPKAQRVMLTDQFFAMERYEEILQARISLLKADLNK